jgi:hypothetical protein
MTGNDSRKVPTSDGFHVSLHGSVKQTYVIQELNSMHAVNVLAVLTEGRDHFRMEPTRRPELEPKDRWR